jgi:DNA-directed RNA polymerase delta subunit
MEEEIKKLLEESIYVQGLPDNEKKLVMQNAQDIASDLLDTTQEDLDAFLKEKYPNAQIIDGNIVNIDEKLYDVRDLYRLDAVNNYLEGVENERFLKSSGIENDPNITGSNVLDAEDFDEDAFQNYRNKIESLEDLPPEKYKEIVSNLSGDEIANLSEADIAEIYKDAGLKYDSEYGGVKNLEEALTDEDIFMRDVQPQIDDYYADLAAREPNVDAVNSYYESLSQADQGMIDNYYDNLITDSQVINVGDTSIKGKAFKKIISNRLKSLFIGGINFLDAYELGLIGGALLEPAVEKVLKPIMPMIIPGYKPPQNNESYKNQVIANLQETAKYAIAFFLIVAGSLGIKDMKDYIRYGDSDSSWKESTGFSRIIQAIIDSNLFGPGTVIYDALLSFKYGAAPVGVLLGPGVQWLNNLLTAVGQFLFGSPRALARFVGNATLPSSIVSGDFKASYVDAIEEKIEPLADKLLDIRESLQ